MLALVVHLAMLRSHKILVRGYICLHFMNFRCFLSVFTFFFYLHEILQQANKHSKTMMAWIA